MVAARAVPVVAPKLLTTMVPPVDARTLVPVMIEALTAGPVVRVRLPLTDCVEKPFGFRLTVAVGTKLVVVERKVVERTLATNALAATSLVAVGPLKGHVVGVAAVGGRLSMTPTLPVPTVATASRAAWTVAALAPAAIGPVT